MSCARCSTWGQVRNSPSKKKTGWLLGISGGTWPVGISPCHECRSCSCWIISSPRSMAFRSDNLSLGDATRGYMTKAHRDAHKPLTIKRRGVSRGYSQQCSRGRHCMASCVSLASWAVTELLDTPLAAGYHPATRLRRQDLALEVGPTVPGYPATPTNALRPGDRPANPPLRLGGLDHGRVA